MAKRPYRSIAVNQVDLKKLGTQVSGDRVVIGVDVAKTKFFASIMNAEQNVVITVRWLHPAQASEFTAFVASVASSAGSLQVAMEPSGVYGDATRYALIAAGFEVFRVSPKRSHDAKEVYDGVPSLHDAKSAAIIAKLHLDGASEPWPIKPDRERELTAALRALEIPEKQYQKNRNRLEGTPRVIGPS